MAVWKAAEAIGWPFGPAVKLMALTGQRRGEIAGMRWGEIDLDAKIWTLPAARAKNNREHVVPLSDSAIAILTALPRVHSREGFVFTLNGAQPVSGFFQAKRRLDAALPSDMPAFTLHDLRRTFASGCARLGIAVHVVEAALNHKSGTIRGVAAVYNKYSYDVEKRACMQAWARHVEVLLGGNVVELAAARG
jgi:integrase